jgi:glycosyltransferase involved in cell wall biosynthesis
MRITIVQGAFLPIPPLRGGAVEKRWFLLSQEFVRRKHVVTHISRQFHGLPDHENIEGVAHIRVRGYDTPSNLLRLKALDFLYTLRVRRILTPADILVSNTFWMPILLRSERFGKVLVDVARMPKGQMRFYRHVSRLRANSSPVKKAIILDDPNVAGQTVMIPNPLTFIPTYEPDWSGKQKVILFAGRICPEKGLPLLLEAFALARRQGMGEWELRLAGPWDVASGGGGEAWLSRLRHTVSQDHVKWLGAIYDVDALNHEYEQASVFVYPSLAEKGETFGLAPLEAMAWGCVPVVSSLSCFQDFIRDGDNGYIFDHRGASSVNNLVEAMIKATQAPHRLGKNALSVRSTHSVSNIADQFLTCFSEMIGK